MRSCNNCCSGKVIIITYSVCVCVCVCMYVRMYVSLGVEQAPRICRMIVASVTCLAVPYISTLSHKVRQEIY